MDLFGDDTIVEEEQQEIIEDASEQSEQFGHPRNTFQIHGFENIEQDILGAYEANRMPHGIILSGLKGIGKATFAYRLARFLLKHGVKNTDQDSLFGDKPNIINTLDVPSNDHISAKVSSGGHPDLLTLERIYDFTKNKTAETLAVSELRKVEPFLRMTSSNGGWRVVIIDDADTMNRNAQNALLKILEEPPKNTVIILIAHRLGALIPTIRSRTRLINCKPLSDEIMSLLLNQKGTDLTAEQQSLLTAMANGSFGQAMEILEEGGLESFLFITNMLEIPNWTEIHRYADQCARAGQEQTYKNFTNTFLWLLKTLAYTKARGQTLAPETLNQPPLSTLLSKSSLAKLLKICENLTQHFNVTERSNLDKRQAVLGAFEIALK